jgi:hypothetical protein
MGDYLEIAGEVGLHARMAAPEGARMVILRNGALFFDTHEREAHIGVPAEPGVYRAEIYAPRAAGTPPIPWLVSNPIYVGMRAAHDGRGEPRLARAGRRSGIATDAWVAEASPGSTSTLQPAAIVDGAALITWRYQLASGSPEGQYAAVRFPVAGLTGHDRVQLRARASGPMRAWIQVRASTIGSGERWGRSVYLDSTLRAIEVPFVDLEPLGPTSTPRPQLDKVDVVLLVVDTVNTRPGASGAIQLADLWLGTQ